jgi:ribosomal protein L11 methyltransferase
MSARVLLTPAQRDAAARGRFVRVDLGQGDVSRSVLVGRVDGTWRAYDNVCRHRALPLDLGADSPMSDDGKFLRCSQHGALYRLVDGLCVDGPCAGDRLSAEPIVEDGDALVLGAPEGARYPYVAIDVDEDEADEAGARLFDLGASGVEARDQTTLARGADGKVTLIASFEHEDDARAASGQLPRGWSPRVEAVVGDAWRDEWKKYFEPFRIAEGVVVCPPWRQYAPKAGESVLVLEPGRAFGTGLHETTSLVAAVLGENVGRFRGMQVLDVGCGSGVLSLVSLALGAASARAVDVDPDAVLVTRENALRNRMNERLHADACPVEELAGQYAAVVANIEAGVLVALAPALRRRVAPGGLLVLSGILSPDAAPGQLDDVRRAYSALKEESVPRKGEWVAVVLDG